MSAEAIRVYIGRDSREPDAYAVTAASLLGSWRSVDGSPPPVVTPLDQRWLRRATLYRRIEHRDPETGQRFDAVDGKPFSTEFSFTRFLVPFLQPGGWALFCDGDFLWIQNVEELWALRDHRYAVQVVQHDYSPAERTKMRGQRQEPYPRKSWSSLVLWNIDHPAHGELTPWVVNTQPGEYLHRFGWLADAQIGALPERWNYLERIGATPVGGVAAAHFTLGTPDMPGCEHSPHAEQWRQILAATQEGGQQRKQDITTDGKTAGEQHARPPF